MENFSCGYPKIKAVITVSNYMVKKYGMDEALRRTIKRGAMKVLKQKA